jgi:hypothetical protein
VGRSAGCELRTLPRIRGVGRDVAQFRAGEVRGACAAGERDRSGRCARASQPTRGLRGTESCPQSQISDRFTCTRAQSRAQKDRSGCFPAGGWETTRSPKTEPRLGRFPGVLRFRDVFRLSVTPSERAENLSATRPASRTRSPAPWLIQPRSNRGAAPDAASCPEVGRFSAPTSWPTTAAGGGCQVAHTTPQSTAPPREQPQPPDAT